MIRLASSRFSYFAVISSNQGIHVSNCCHAFNEKNTYVKNLSIVCANSRVSRKSQLDYCFSTSTQESTTSQNRNTQPSLSKQAQQQSQKFSAIDYYRNTIRKVKINSKTKKGKFNSFYLLNIVHLTKTSEHAKIMFEAYYNYLGHLTLIPNKVVDQLITRAIRIHQAESNQIEAILQVFGNHNYLAYFPHYHVTQRLIEVLSVKGDTENLDKLLKILIRSPLIKIDTLIMGVLLNVYSGGSQKQTFNVEDSTKQLAAKVLLYRCKLVNGSSSEQVLKKLADRILARETHRPHDPKVSLKKVIQELMFDENENSAAAAEQTKDKKDDIEKQEGKESISTVQKAINLAIIATNYQMLEESGRILSIQKVELGQEFSKYFNFLKDLYPTSSQEINYGQALKESLQPEVKLSAQNLKILEDLSSSSSTQDVKANEANEEKEENETNEQQSIPQSEQNEKK